jgi:predicted DNA-binding transcriptional regulator AlpA
MPIIVRAEERRRRLADQLCYPPRMLRADRAAAYLAMSTSQFLKMVEARELPAPIKVHAMAIWDRLELDAAIEDWRARQDEPARRNTFLSALGVEDDE